MFIQNEVLMNTQFLQYRLELLEIHNRKYGDRWIYNVIAIPTFDRRVSSVKISLYKLKRIQNTIHVIC